MSKYETAVRHHYEVIAFPHSNYASSIQHNICAPSFFILFSVQEAKSNLCRLFWQQNTEVKNVISGKKKKKGNSKCCLTMKTNGNNHKKKRLHEQHTSISPFLVMNEVAQVKLSHLEKEFPLREILQNKSALCWHFQKALTGKEIFHGSYQKQELARY